MPGQAYQDGLGFVQFYFGLPIAMVLLSAIVLPIYHRLRVYTAYEYLEQRFDRRTRQFTALLFLVSRGLASGLAIYAPALVLSAVLGWPVLWTNWALGRRDDRLHRRRREPRGQPDPDRADGGHLRRAC